MAHNTELDKCIRFTDHLQPISGMSGLYVTIDVLRGMTCYLEDKMKWLPSIRDIAIGKLEVKKFKGRYYFCIINTVHSLL